MCERRRGRRRGAREGACTGAATMLQPSTLRLILNAAALAAASPKYPGARPGGGGTLPPTLAHAGPTLDWGPLSCARFEGFLAWDGLLAPRAALSSPSRPASRWQPRRFSACCVLGVWGSCGVDGATWASARRRHLFVTLSAGHRPVHRHPHRALW